MRRRAVLATVGAVAVAGCGWSQDPNRGRGRAGGPEETEQPTLAGSEGGDGPIEADAEELLLTVEDLDAEAWRKIDVQMTGTCNNFERSTEDYTFAIDACAAVYEDEATASEEYQSVVDRSPKVLDGRADREPEIGDETALFTNDGGYPRTDGPNIRLLFRDTNATARVDFERAIRTDTSDVPEYGVADVSVWGARMHDRWRG